ncbi:MAG: deacylase [Planctomycetes bacterium]|nr:deacylase [Planctomycetota bacterium]
MCLIGNRLGPFLDQRGVAYEVIDHAPDYSAQQTAADTGTPGHSFAKSVLLVIDGRLTLAVVPADRIVDMAKVANTFGAGEVTLAEEEALEELCPDCEIGAEPPFGHLYGVPMVVDAELCRDRRITFNAGNHEQAVRMDTIDFLKLAHPRVMDLAA